MPPVAVCTKRSSQLKGDRAYAGHTMAVVGYNPVTDEPPADLAALRTTLLALEYSQQN